MPADVITSYSIHYTKLYDRRCRGSRRGDGRHDPVLMMDRITVVVDTREQEPYSFDSDKVSAVRKALPAGDYSLVGLEELV